MIEQQALIVIKQSRGQIPTIESARQLQHVVSAAALSRLDTLLELGAQTPWGSQPGFRIACSAGYIGTSGCNFIEEVLRQIAKATVARDLVSSCRRGHLRDMRVGV